MNSLIEYIYFLYFFKKNALVIYTNIFRDNSQDSIKSLEALMGKAKASEMQKKFNITLDSLNEIIVQFPKFLPALDEKAKVLMMIGDWVNKFTEKKKKSFTFTNQIYKIQNI